MNGTRFARTGRCRFFVCLGVFVIMILFVAIFHSSQLQLDESREQRLRCEQEQEGLNKQLRTMLEQRFTLEKTHDQERNDHMATRLNLEEKLKDAIDLHEKEQLQTRVRYEKLEKTFKLLQVKYNELETECIKGKKQHLEDTNTLEKKLQTLRSELQRDKNMQAGEMTTWKKKYDALLQEKEQLERFLGTKDADRRITNLEAIITYCRHHCEAVPKELQLNKPLSLLQTTTRNISSRQMSGIDKPHNLKSFSEQLEVGTGNYWIAVNQTNKSAAIIQNFNSTDLVQINKTNILPGHSFKFNQMPHLLPFSSLHQNNSMILNSVGNLQITQKSANSKLSEENEIKLREQQLENVGAAPLAAALAGDKMVSPLSAPRKHTSTDATKINEQRQKHLNQTPNAIVTNSTSSNLQPLPVPPKLVGRKLPENVAPIPDNFGESNKMDPADIDTAAEDLRKNDDDGKNNRYTNAEAELEAVKQQQKSGANEDSGAHEVKDHDQEFLSDGNFNLPPNEDNHFFDSAVGAAAADKHIGDIALEGAAAVDTNNNNDDLIANDADGDVAVKPHKHLLDVDNLNNEIAGDQGKEFADGLRLEDVNEEDQDEDDYSLLAARKQGAEAIRN